MITFDTREPAPLSVRWARVVVPLIMCFAYMVFRVVPATRERIPLTELVTSGVLFVGLTFVAFIALGDLLFPATPAELAAEEDPESTGVFDAVPARITLTAGDDGTGWGAFVGVLPGPATSARELREIAEAMADTEEFQLLTHEYVPQHHTPARGITLVRPDLLPPESYTPEPRISGRHRRH